MENEELNDKSNIGGKKGQPKKSRKKKFHGETNSKQYAYFGGLSNCWNDSSLTESFDLYRKPSVAPNSNMESLDDNTSCHIPFDDTFKIMSSQSLDNCLQENNIDLTESTSSFEAIVGRFAFELEETAECREPLDVDDSLEFGGHDSLLDSSRSEVRESSPVNHTSAPLRPRMSKFKVPYKTAKSSKCDLDSCQYCIVESNCDNCYFCVNKAKL